MNPKHLCSHKGGKPGRECTGPSVCRCGQTWVGPWVRGRYFLSSKGELRSKESPPSPDSPPPPQPSRRPTLGITPTPFSSSFSPCCSPSPPHTHTHSLSQHQLFSLHLRAPLPTSSPFLLLPASPLCSADDSFPISSTKSSSTILSHPSYCLRFTPPL